MIFGVVACEAPGGAAIVGKAGANSEPTVSAAVKAMEPRCFKAVTPLFSHVPFIGKRRGCDKVPCSG